MSSLIERADRAAHGGQPAQAWDLYSRAWTLEPANPLSARGICRLAIAYRQQGTAAEVCQRALVLGRSAQDMRNRVAAWLMGPAAPPLDDVVSASFMADGAVRIAPSEPWGYLARADIALRLGDRDLLNAALADLRRVAPAHEQTKRLAALAGPRASRWVWVGRFALLFGVFYTLLDGVWRRWRRSARVSRVAAVAVAALVWLLPIAASAEYSAPPSTEIDESHPEKSLAEANRAGNPLAFGDLLVTFADRAQEATRRGDHAAAARYWTAVTQAVPDRAYGFARLCDVQIALQRWEDAIGSCRSAITREGATLGDYSRFVGLLLSKVGPLETVERRQVEVAIGQVAKTPGAALDAERLRCDLAVHEHDVLALRACTAALLAGAPDDRKTLSFAWGLAMEDGDRAAAEGWLARARGAGVDAGALARMETATHALRPAWRIRLKLAGKGGFEILALMLSLGAVGFALTGLVDLRAARGAAPKREEQS